MAARLLFVLTVLSCTHLFADPPTTASGNCPIETVLEEPQRKRPRVHPSNNFGDAPFILKEMNGAFESAQVESLRKIVEDLGLHLDPGVEYLHDAGNAVKAYDQWKIDLDKVLKDPKAKRRAEDFVLAYLQNPPNHPSGYAYHPGLDPNSPLPRKKSLDEYFDDQDCRYKLGVMQRTFENYLQFRNVLEADLYRDPARRAKAIS